MRTATSKASRASPGNGFIASPRPGERDESQGRVEDSLAGGRLKQRGDSLDWRAGRTRGTIGPLPCSQLRLGPSGSNGEALAVEGSTTQVQRPIYPARGPSAR
jgi:hypothetical protein